MRFARFFGSSWLRRALSTTSPLSDADRHQLDRHAGEGLHRQLECLERFALVGEVPVVSPVSTPWIAPLNPKPDLTHYTCAFRGPHNGMLASYIQASALSAERWPGYRTRFTNMGKLVQTMDGALGNPGLFGDGAHAPMSCGLGLAKITPRTYGTNTNLLGKRLQLLKDAFPDLTTTAVFWDQSSADHSKPSRPNSSCN